MRDVYEYLTQKNVGYRISSGFNRLSIHSSMNRNFQKSSIQSKKSNCKTENREKTN